MHIGSKKSSNSSELGLRLTTANLNLKSVDTGTGCALCEEQKRDFDKNLDSVPSYS